MSSSASLLAQRQWRQAAQRNTRIALTALKDTRTKYQAASSAGHDALTQLSNAMLTWHYLPGMALGALAGVEGLQQAAAAKLLRQQEAALASLRSCCEQMQQLLQDASSAVDQLQQQAYPGADTTGPSVTAAVAAQADPISSDPHGPSQPGSTLSASANAATTGGVCAPSTSGLTTAAGSSSGVPVFHSLSAPALAGLMRHLLCMWGQDLADKQAIVEAVAGHVADVRGDENEEGLGEVRSSPGAWGRRRAEPAGAEEVKGRLTVLLTAWLLSPRVCEEEAEELLGVMTEDMAGF